MKILVLGNSHAVGLFRLYRDKKECGEKSFGAEIDFLVLDGDALLPNLDISSTLYLVPKNTEVKRAIYARGLQETCLNTYDFVIIYGCQLRTMGPGVNWFKHIAKRNTFFSSTVENLSIQDFIHNTSHIRFLRRQKAVNIDFPPKEPIFVSMPSPLPNERSLYLLRHRLMNWRKVFHRHMMSSEIARKTDLAIERELESLDVFYLDTPPELLNAQGVATRKKFGRKAKYARKLKRIILDTWHLNALGEELVFRHLLETLEKISALPAPARKRLNAPPED